MAPEGVVAVELAHVSIAGVFHFPIDENVSGEQGHLGAHVHPVDDLSDVAVLRLPWAGEKDMFTLQRRRPFRDRVFFGAKPKKTWTTLSDGAPTQLMAAEKKA